MEINFENRNIDIFREFFCQTKRIQEVAESVVPDTNEDIAKIAAVQSSVLLKSKDVTGRGVLISGEATASLMYITEGQDKVSFLKLTKSFSMEYEIADIRPDTVAQINLSVLSAEARVINPRKVSVCFEIAGELSCYVSEPLSVESGIAADECRGLHAKYESRDVNVITSVCEKTFTLSEQFSFPGGKPCPSRLISGAVDFVVNDTQLIGTKVMIKGSADISVSYLSDEVNYPVKAEFSTAFSQIIDIGEETMDSCTVTAALTGVYFDVADSISGDKLLDAEMHAVLQLVCRNNRQIVYISDAYSNLMPAQCGRESYNISVMNEYRKLKVSADERLNIMDDCADVLSLFVSLSNLSQEQNCVKATVNMDVVYRTGGGQLSAVRRNMSLETELPAAGCKINSVRLSDVYMRPDGQYIDAHLALELGCLVCGSVEIDKVVCVTLDEEAALALEDYPTVTLVRCSGESLWELAKNYHSSVERIRAANDTEAELNGRMILVPKCI